MNYMILPACPADAHVLLLIHFFLGWTRLLSETVLPRNLHLGKSKTTATSIHSSHPNPLLHPRTAPPQIHFRSTKGNGAHLKSRELTDSQAGTAKHQATGVLCQEQGFVVLKWPRGSIEKCQPPTTPSKRLKQHDEGLVHAFSSSSPSQFDFVYFCLFTRLGGLSAKSTVICFNTIFANNASCPFCKPDVSEQLRPTT